MSHSRTIRQWYMLLTALLLLSSIVIRNSGAVFAQSGVVTSAVTASITTPAVGEQIDVVISIDVSGVNAPDNALGSFTSVLTYNPAVLQYSSNSGVGAGFTGVVNPTAGQVTFNGANVTGATGNVTVLTITFNVIGAGAGNLGLSYSAMAAATTFQSILPLVATPSVDDVQASVAPAEYTLTTNTVGNGTVTKDPDQATYTDGTVVDVTATPASGWSFSGWSGACSGTGACQVTMDGNKSVTATFTEIPPAEYTLTTNTVGNGTVTKDPDQATYTDGTVVDVTATPACGWSFSGWSGACSGTGACEVTMNSNRSVTATFTEIPPVCHTLTLAHVGNGSDPVATPTNSPGCELGSYVAGQAITVSGASPAEDWEIIGWTGTAQDDATSDTNTLVMPAEDHTVSVTYDDTTVPTTDSYFQYLPSITN